MRRRSGRQAMENVFFFVPNLIGYARIVFAVISFYFMPTYPTPAAFFYILSGFLDAFDGWAARKFNQGTMFGAVLDMVTDRCATTCLIVVLGYLYPSYLFIFQLVIALDISSHWIQMYSSLIKGDSSHKVTDLSENPIMRFYYMRPILFTFCACNELFFSSVYMAYFSPGWPVSFIGYEVGLWVVLAYITLPMSFLKQCVSILQLMVACKNIGSLDAVQRSQRADTN